MNSLIFVIAMGIAVIALLLLAFRRSDQSRRAKLVRKAKLNKAATNRSTTQWRAVRIAPELICCEAVQKLAGRVFLAQESPHLPLDACTEVDCRCKYVHLKDRRSGGDRRIELGELDAFLPINQVERRQLSGRRTTDLAA